MKCLTVRDGANCTIWSGARLGNCMPCHDTCNQHCGRRKSSLHCLMVMCVGWLWTAVFYEELVERPESVAMQLLSACGLQWEPEVLSFHQTDRPVQTASTEQVCGNGAYTLLAAERLLNDWSVEMSSGHSIIRFT